MSITAQRLTVTRASGVVGAEVSGLDFATPPDDRSIAELRAIWLEHGVLFLRDAVLPPRDFLAFADEDFKDTVGAGFEFVGDLVGFQSDQWRFHGDRIACCNQYFDYRNILEIANIRNFYFNCLCHGISMVKELRWVLACFTAATGRRPAR